MKIAFVFSGQGAQAPGMGKELYETSPAAKDVFLLADRLRPGTSRQCFEGTAEELGQTKNTQPCLFSVDLAAARALYEAGVHPAMVAGFSLGEIAALAYAGVLTDAEGFSFVCQRGEAMQKAAEAAPGSMAAVLRLRNEQVEALCSEFQQVYPVNYNCPGQLVVAGAAEDMDAFCARVAESGGKAIPLQVSGSFHSPFMEPVVPALSAALETMTLSEPQLPVYANVNAHPYAGDKKSLLLQQVTRPVRWQETIEAMAQAGVDTFIEVGVGKTLCGLIKKTVKGAKVLHVQDADSLDKTITEVLG